MSFWFTHPTQPRPHLLSPTPPSPILPYIIHHTRTLIGYLSHDTIYVSFIRHLFSSSQHVDWSMLRIQKKKKIYNFCHNSSCGKLLVVEVWTYHFTSTIYNSSSSKLWQKLWFFFCVSKIFSVDPTWLWAVSSLQVQ